MKTKFRKKGGYSQQLANEIFSPALPFFSLSTETEEKYDYVDGKRTNKVVGHAAWFVQEGLPPFEVKFPEDIALPAFQAIVTFDELVACEVRNNIYFRANGYNEVE